MKSVNCYHSESETCALCVRLFGPKEDTAQQPDRSCGGGWGQIIAEMRPTFERCADKTLDEVRSIYAERGAQYADTWAEENNVRAFTREAFEWLDGMHKPFDAKDARIIQLAALIDVKISRMAGGYKSDTVADLIAYLATYKTLREEYEAG